MDLGIKGKKALVTGGGRGIGRSIAACLAQEGVDVAVVSRTQSDVDGFVNEYGSNHTGFSYDLLDESGPTELIEDLNKNFGLPDIIIHNVGGTLDITDPFCSLKEWKKVYRFNLEIAVELNLLLTPNLIEKKWGRIIHVASISALENQGTVPYCTMKAALCAYTRSFGRYISPHGISVSAILPGAVYTEGGYWDMTSKTRPEHVEKYLNERMAIKRFGVPEEIGNVVTFLCSEQASFIVGSSFTVDGGQGRNVLFQHEAE